MFAVFLSNKMDPFYEIIVSFPTVIFTVFLIFSIFYWALAVLGLVDIDVLDFEVPESANINSAGDAFSLLNILSGLMLKLGLNGVPVAIVASLVTLFGWLFSFLAVFFLFPIIPTAILKFLVGILIFIGTAYCAAIVTAWLIKPLRPLFLASNQEVQRNILGQSAVVRTGVVDKTFGEALIEDGGAGLIVKVRSYKDETFKRGERVVLIEYLASENIYRVVSEAEFTA